MHAVHDCPSGRTDAVARQVSKILMTKCIKRIRDLFEYVLYKFTLYLLTYFAQITCSYTLQWLIIRTKSFLLRPTC